MTVVYISCSFVEWVGEGVGVGMGVTGHTVV